MIKDFTGVQNIRSIITSDLHKHGCVYGYIDHQSAACDGENLEMFENDDALARFLFGKESRIVLDNDNH